VKFAFIRDNIGYFDVIVMCDVLRVATSGYYAWCKRPESARAKRARELAEQIRIVHAASRRTYGSIRVCKHLRKSGTVVCRNTIAKLMKEAGIRAKTCKKFRVSTTDSNHNNPVAPNVLDRRFVVSELDKVWVTDITYLHTGEGVLYLAGIMDLCSRRIIGWSMSETMTAQLVVDAMDMAVKARDPHPGLMHHSDRGVQYTCGRYREFLAEHDITVSMSRRGNCYDNAVMESFWGKLKTEELYDHELATRDHARAIVFDYIEVFYNRLRSHSALGYISPDQFEASRKRV
jgi:transposase InsO family protein